MYVVIGYCRRSVHCDIDFILPYCDFMNKFKLVLVGFEVLSLVWFLVRAVALRHRLMHHKHSNRFIINYRTYQIAAVARYFIGSQ